MTRQDQIFHLRQGTDNEFKCDFFTETFAGIIELCDHITNKHKKCTLFANTFPNTESLETHVLAVHKKGQSKHNIGRDHSIKNHKNKEISNPSFSF